MKTKISLCLIGLTCAVVAQAQTEGFDNVPNLFASGSWNQTNSSDPVNPLNTNPWVQGDPVNSGIIAHSGADDSYIAANYSAVDTEGTISAWLFTPTRTWQNGDSLSFFTTTAMGSTFADRLQVRLSMNGASTFVGGTADSVGDYSDLLLDINPTLDPTGYPQSWMEYSATISGLSAATMGRLAFRYYVADGGSNGANSNIVAIDDFRVKAVPEPAPLMVFGLGAAGLLIRRRRQG
jgi:hypothetical protein